MARVFQCKDTDYIPDDPSTHADRVWIELEIAFNQTNKNGKRVKGSVINHLTCKQRAARATRMLEKLGITWEYFRWSEHHLMYELVNKENHTYYALPNNGEWFNLEMIANGSY